MDRVVHTQPYSNDNVDAGDDVNGDAPEVKEADNVSEGEDDNTKHHQTNLKVGQEDKSDDKNTENGKTHISPELKPNNSVSLPGCINLHKAESIL